MSQRPASPRGAPGAARSSRVALDRNFSVSPAHVRKWLLDLPNAQVAGVPLRMTARDAGIAQARVGVLKFKLSKNPALPETVCIGERRPEVNSANDGCTHSISKASMAFQKSVRF